MHVFNGVLYVVAGGKLFSIDAAGALSAPGALATSVGRVYGGQRRRSSGVGGNQLMIADGVAGYVYNVATGVFSKYRAGACPRRGGDLTYIDGYFVIGEAGSMTAYASNLYDGTTWDTLAAPPSRPRPTRSRPLRTPPAALVHQGVHVGGLVRRGQCRRARASRSRACPGPSSTTARPRPFRGAGRRPLFFLASQRNNDGGDFVGVVELSGFTPQVMSPPPITYRMSPYPTMSDAFGYCYSDGGHTFYVITFPAGNATWVYDATTGCGTSAPPGRGALRSTLTAQDGPDVR